MYLNIKESAIFIADSHFSSKNQQLLQLLKRIDNDEINTSQIFLMGDMIDFISGESKYFIKQNRVIIDILNNISTRYKIIYLEGNHDYNLKNLFPNINVIKRENQPLLARYKNKTVSLSHGDNFTDWSYNLYCSVIRNSVFLKFLNFIDINYFISKKIENALLQKNICHQIKEFEKLASKRVSNYETDIVIEGHFHQGKCYEFKNKKYVNIPSLCCNRKYMQLENLIFKEKLL